MKFLKILHRLLFPPKSGTAKMSRPRHYNDGQGEFILELVNDFVVRVSHRNQVGWIGVSVDWDPQEPYTHTTFSSQLKDGGIDRAGLEFATPDEALRSLCWWLLRQQRKEDARSVKDEESREAARRALREFLNELPG